MICKICGSNNLQKKIYLKDLKHKTTKEQFLLYRCKSCGVYNILHNKYDVIESEKYYPQTYSAFHNLNESRKDIDKTYSLNVVKGRLAWAKILNLKSHKKILDIGCGNGKNIEFLNRKYNTNIVGIEPNLHAVNKGIKNGLKIYNNTIENLDEREKYDLIYMLHVIEHLKDPVKSIKKAYNILNPGGQIIIGTPNTNSFERYIFRKYWDGWDTPRHLFIFNSNNIKSLLFQAGFKDINIYYEVYSLFNRSLNNFLEDKRLKKNKPLKILISKLNIFLAWILPFTRFSGAIQVIAKKPI
jgi:2-polyprenyl-3-methyl-5-hydroxy-6-metoxy-1,4-benzoquinol methylase